MLEVLNKSRQEQSLCGRVEAVFKGMFDGVCQSIQQLDGNVFNEKKWARDHNGKWVSGQNSEDTTYIDRSLKDGNVFEKIGVNYVAVSGELPPGMNFQKSGALPSHKIQQSSSNRYSATGTSFVIHPVNPMAPIAHVNYRYFQVGDREQPEYWWFGGGADLTPAYLFEEDVVHFHQVHKAACDKHDPKYYSRFKQWCDEYFHIAHRGESRGVGGIFFDQLNDRPVEDLLAFITDCTKAFPQAYLPLVERRKDMEFTEANKYWQRIVRGRYVEFILTADRGARFGLASGMVHQQSVFNCMPPEASWSYDDQPMPGSQEAVLRSVLKQPQSWV